MISLFWLDPESESLTYTTSVIAQPQDRSDRSVITNISKGDFFQLEKTYFVLEWPQNMPGFLIASVSEET